MPRTKMINQSLMEHSQTTMTMKMTMITLTETMNLTRRRLKRRRTWGIPTTRERVKTMTDLHTMKKLMAPLRTIMTKEVRPRSEDDDRLAYNEEVNGATEDYNDQGSEAEDEDDDDEDAETVPVVRGKKRKFDSEDLLQ